MTKLIFRTILGMALAIACIAARASDIQRFEPDSMARIAEEHRGHPFVVVMWSLDCEFCKASLETLAQARRQHSNLAVVTISTDFADDPDLAPVMHERLFKLGMENDAWAFGSLPPERLRYAVDHSWHGEKPRSYWFNARGERVAYSGVITPAVIEKYFNR